MIRLSTPLALLALLLVMLAGIAAQAQQPPPTIINFNSDLETIALAEAEARVAQTTLSWHVVGMTGAHTLTLYSYQLGHWDTLAQGPLPATGTLQITIAHSLTFAPPTYRLVIHAANRSVVDERVLAIPYTAPAASDPPAIETFMADVTQVNADALSQVRVLWHIANRPPTANLSFVQVLEDGQLVSVELPRPSLWVSSAGQGPINPTQPDNSDTIRLRLRLVDLVDGTVYDEQDVTLVVVGEAAPLPPSPQPVTSSTAEIVSFTVSPEVVDRGGEVTLNWEVRGATELTVWRLNPVGQIAEWLEDIPPVGSWALSLQDYYVDQAMFMLWASDADENSVSQSLTVRVRCPYTYFFGAPPSGEACPMREVQEIAAAAQRFERGTMIWRSDWRIVYVLYDNNRLERYQDTWQEGEAVDTGQPPAGLVQPVRGFGKVWASHSWVREGLGWATGPEQAYSMQVQSSGAYRYANTYFTLPDDRVVAIVESNWHYVSE